MSFSVSVTSDSLPDPRERIVSIRCIKGGFLDLPYEVGFEKNLTELSKDEQIDALKKIISELDASEESQGSTGAFANEYAFEHSLITRTDFVNKYREFKNSGYDGHLIDGYPFRNEIEFCGNCYRISQREICVRFFLYLKAGYQITFES